MTPGQIAANWAMKQKGKPYVFGASGPSFYDCSGLTMKAWDQPGANVDLPHNSLQQSYATHRVFRNGLKLKIGDLVFYYGPEISHVGILTKRDALGRWYVTQATAPGIGVEVNIRVNKYATPYLYGRPDYPGWNL